MHEDAGEAVPEMPQQRTEFCDVCNASELVFDIRVESMKAALSQDPQTRAPTWRLHGMFDMAIQVQALGL